MLNPGPIETLDTILGENYLAIQSTQKVYARHIVDRPTFKLAVATEGEVVTVLVTDADGKVDATKSVGVRVGTETELNASELAAISARFDRIEKVETVRVSSLLAIRVSETSFRKQMPDVNLKQYKIQVVREGTSVIVILTAKDLVPGTRGANQKCPGFEVELKSSDLSVLRANFTR